MDLILLPFGPIHHCFHEQGLQYAWLIILETSCLGRLLQKHLHNYFCYRSVIVTGSVVLLLCGDISCYEPQKCFFGFHFEF